MKIDKWDAVAYDIAFATGNSSHIRAHWLQAGTWIDVHLSLTSDRPPRELRAALQTVLGAIRVKEKSP